MSTLYAVGKRALGICDRCGFQYLLADLRPLVINREEVDLRVCDECWEPDHPQNEQGRYPIREAQALRNPRPDRGEYDESRATVVPVVGQRVSVAVGSVTVSIV